MEGDFSLAVDDYKRESPELRQDVTFPRKLVALSLNFMLEN